MVQVNFLNSLITPEVSLECLSTNITLATVCNHFRVNARAAGTDTIIYKSLLTELIALPYVLNNKGLTIYFKKQQLLATQIAELQIKNGNSVYVGNESMIAFTKEAFLVSGHTLTNIYNINTKLDNKNTMEQTTHPYIWEETQLLHFQTLYDIKLCKVYAHSEKGMAKELAIAAQLQAKIDDL